MRGLKLPFEIAHNGTWICGGCLRNQRQIVERATCATTARGSSIANGVASRGFRSGYSKALPVDGTRSVGSSGYGPPPRKPRLNGLRLGLVLAALTAAGSVSVFSDNAKHSYAAATRSLRVLSALSRSVRE